MPPVWKPMDELKPLASGAPMELPIGLDVGKADMVEPCTVAGRAVLVRDILFRDVMLLRRLLVRSLVCKMEQRFYSIRDWRSTCFSPDICSFLPVCWWRRMVWQTVVPTAAGSLVWLLVPAPWPIAVSPLELETPRQVEGKRGHKQMVQKRTFASVRCDVFSVLC